MANDSTLRQLEQILKKNKPYNVKTDKEKRDLDTVNGTIGDIANVLATLINDLKKKNIL